MKNCPGIDKEKSSRLNLPWVWKHCATCQNFRKNSKQTNYVIRNKCPHT